MLIPITRYSVRCDYHGCEQAVTGHGIGYKSSDAVLADAAGEGWLRRNGLDFCPRHRGDVPEKSCTGEH